MLDLNRPIQTRSGYPVRIIATDVKGDTENKLVALVDHGDEEILAIRTREGRVLPDDQEHPEDFVNAPTVEYRNVYLNDNNESLVGEPADDVEIAYSQRSEHLNPFTIKITKQGETVVGVELA